MIKSAQKARAPIARGAAELNNDRRVKQVFRSMLRYISRRMRSATALTPRAVQRRSLCVSNFTSSNRRRHAFASVRRLRRMDLRRLHGSTDIRAAWIVYSTVVLDYDAAGAAG